MPARVHEFLRGQGHDGSGRRLADVVSFDDGRIEAVHNFVQWLFPLAEDSRAVAGSPVLGAAEAAVIRADPQALAGFRAGLDRMARFYAESNGWLTGFDHNHLRITRIIAATRNLLGQVEAERFHQAILLRNAAAGSPINRDSLRFWKQAAAAER